MGDCHESVVNTLTLVIAKTTLRATPHTKTLNLMGTTISAVELANKDLLSCLENFFSDHHPSDLLERQQSLMHFFLENAQEEVDNRCISNTVYTFNALNILVAQLKEKLDYLNEIKVEKDERIN